MTSPSTQRWSSASEDQTNALVPVRRRRARLAYRNDYYSLYDDDVDLADGTPSRWTRLEFTRPGHGVAILPTHRDLIGLVRVYRYAIGAWDWAIPRGFAQSENPIVTARAELREELGSDVEKATFHHLGEIHPDSGILATRVVCFLARVESIDTTPTDTDEVSATRWLTRGQLHEEIRSGQIKDAFTIAALALADVHDLFSGG